MSKRGFDATILREYDIRGIVGETLSEDDAELLGLTFGTYAGRGGARAIAVGYDGRISSPGLAAALGKGLMQSGQNVFDVGLGPTPMLYFSTFHLPVDGGVMITGSHNPPEYNGFKMSLQKEPFFGEAIQALAVLAREDGLDVGGGVETHCSVFDAYIDRLVQDFEPGRALKVAWDAGNGAAGETLVALTARLPGEHILLFEEIDGTFPNHHPDPTVPANLTTLRETVLEHGCDLGIAFDGDGDRIGAIDETGEILWGDQIMLLLARDVLARMPGVPIIADVKASQVLFDGIEAMGGKPVMWKTGHSVIKSKMKELNSPFGGEMSAHLFFADRYYGYDDALYAAVRMLNVAGRKDGSLAKFRTSLPKVCNTPELRFDCPEDRKFVVVDEVRDRLRSESADIIDIDGVRVRTEDGWWLLRASNTQAVLVARCEAYDEAGLDRLKAMLAAQLSQSGISPPKL